MTRANGEQMNHPNLTYHLQMPEELVCALPGCSRRFAQSWPHALSKPCWQQRSDSITTGPKTLGEVITGGLLNTGFSNYTRIPDPLPFF
eukprot:823546-Amphidinium_carterae.1